jgi:glycosyltransferase involved in cell wall biosynthesis
MKPGKLKIGIIAMGLESSRDFRSAGVARYAFSLLDAIAQDPTFPHEFHFFLLPSFEIPPHWKQAKAKHIRVHRTWKRYNKWTLLVSGLIAKKLGLDFLLSTANSIPLLSPVPTGVFIHDLFPLDHPEWFPDATATVNEKTIPRAVRNSRLVLANSEATRRDIIRHFQVDGAKVVVTPLAGGNEIERLTESQIDRTKLSSLGIPFARYILTLSTIEPRKNLGRLVEAFARLKADPELSDLGLVVAGSKGWKYDEALAKVDELSLGESVKLVGYVEDKELPLLFGASEFYICPSVSEGFGMPLVEAMAAGAPVLSSDGGALPEVGGNAVRYFDPLSVDSIAEAMKEAIWASGQRSEWVNAGLDQAALFDWHKTAKATVSAIERVI